MRLRMQRGELYLEIKTGKIWFYSGRDGDWACMVCREAREFIKVSRDWVPKRFSKIAKKNLDAPPKL